MYRLIFNSSQSLESIDLIQTKLMSIACFILLNINTPILLPGYPRSSAATISKPTFWCLSVTMITATYSVSLDSTYKPCEPLERFKDYHKVELIKEAVFANFIILYYGITLLFLCFNKLFIIYMIGWLRPYFSDQF